jgi:prevent-host-death family protein
MTPPQTALVVGAYEAKSRLSALLDRVETGQEVIITRHGHPVARLVPEPQKFDAPAAAAALERITAMRKRLESEGVWFKPGEIRGLLNQERRSD